MVYAEGEVTQPAMTEAHLEWAKHWWHLLLPHLRGAEGDPEAASSGAGTTFFEHVSKNGTKPKKLGKKPTREEMAGQGAASTDVPHRAFGFETQELLNLAIEAEEGEQRTRRRQHQEDMERQRRAFPDSTEEDLVSKVLAAEEMAEMEEFQNAEDRAAEEEWREMEKERAFAEQQEKFKRLKEAQQMRKQARLADWAVWKEHQDAMKVENEMRTREKQAADWAAWTNEQAKEYDRVQAQLKAREFRDWEQWVVLNEPPDEPKGSPPVRQRQVRVEAGVTVGDTQPVKKARWTFKLAQGLAHKIGFHFTIQAVEDETPGLAATEMRPPPTRRLEERQHRGAVPEGVCGDADAGVLRETEQGQPGAGPSGGREATARPTPQNNADAFGQCYSRGAGKLSRRPARQPRHARGFAANSQSGTARTGQCGGHAAEPGRV